MDTIPKRNNVHSVDFTRFLLGIMFNHLIKCKEGWKMQSWKLKYQIEFLKLKGCRIIFAAADETEVRYRTER